MSFLCQKPFRWCPQWIDTLVHKPAANCKPLPSKTTPIKALDGKYPFSCCCWGKYVQYFTNLWNLHLQNAWNRPCNTYRPPFLSGTVECLQNLRNLSLPWNVWTRSKRPRPGAGHPLAIRRTAVGKKTEDPKNSPIVFPASPCVSLLHAAARKCGTPWTPVIITSPCQQPSSPAHRVGGCCAGRSFGFDHLQCQLFGWLISVPGEWKSPFPISSNFKLHENSSNTIVQGGQGKPCLRQSTPCQHVPCQKQWQIRLHAPSVTVCESELCSWSNLFSLNFQQRKS